MIFEKLQAIVKQYCEQDCKLEEKIIKLIIEEE